MQNAPIMVRADVTDSEWRELRKHAIDLDMTVQSITIARVSGRQARMLLVILHSRSLAAL